jgi:penicillin-binding protein 1A
MARSRNRKTTRKEPQLFAPGKRKPPQSRAPERGSITGWVFRKLFKLGIYTSVIAALVFGFAWFTLDQKGLFNIPERAPGIMILANDGTVLAEQGAFYGDEARLELLPDYVPNAIVAMEDRRFRYHYGVDPIGVVRAVVRGFQAGKPVQGGSTLTQQLAKNLFLTPERTAWRKIQEVVLAVWLERKFSKDEILQLYLNRVYFAGGSNGIERGAKSVYNKSAGELSLMEAATLAGILPAPSTYNPASNPEAAQTRAKLVLDAMLEQGYITQEESHAAQSAPTSVGAADYIPAKQYAIDWINEQLPQLVKSYDTSIIVQTTIDPVMQSDAETALRKRLTANSKKLNVSQGAMIVLDTKGAVMALVGGKSYKGSQYNRVTKAKRQPGSTFKPFVYLAAMEQGYKPESVAVDEPIRIGNWTPDNYGNKYMGAVTLETAFAQSLNSVAARLTQEVGPVAVIDTAQRLGINSPLNADASIALGTSEVTLLELATAFVPFANGGEAVQPYVVTRISTRDGDVLYERVGSGLGKVVSDYDVGGMNQLFRAVVQRGTAKKAQFGNFDIGGKTGTSQSYRDAWFVGFTSYYVAGVWLGNDDNSPTNKVTGGSLPALIWRDVMELAHAGLPQTALPGELAPVADDLLMSGDLDGPEVQQQDEIVVAEQAPRKKKKYLLDYLFGDDGPEPKRRSAKTEDGLY